jgi:hypothetical protein
MGRLSLSVMGTVPQSPLERDRLTSPKLLGRWLAEGVFFGSAPTPLSADFAAHLRLSRYRHYTWP